jgi:hypothetical protein
MERPIRAWQASTDPIALAPVAGRSPLDLGALRVVDSGLRARAWPRALGAPTQGRQVSSGRIGGKICSEGFSVDKSQVKRFCYQGFGWRLGVSIFAVSN